MKSKASLLFLILLPLTTFAGKKEHSHSENKKTKRHHHAHEHGAGELSIAFDGKAGRLEFKAAAESIVGFEHEAKKTTDIAVVEKSIADFKNQISTMVKMDPKLNCVFLAGKVELLREKKSSHADFVAEFNIQCESLPLGSKLVIDFTNYKKLEDLKAMVLIDQVQKSLDIDAKLTEVELK